MEVDYKAGKPARIDGTVAFLVAVEIDSRVAKQVRGAVLDLICHPYRKKLLVLIPAHMSNVDITAQQCRIILDRFVGSEHFRVVVLRGTGNFPQLEGDVEAVKSSLIELGWNPGGDV